MTTAHAPEVRPLSAPTDAELAALSALALRSKAHWGYDAAFLEACRPVLTLTRGRLAAERLAVTRIGPAFAGLALVSAEGDVGHLEMLFVDPPRIGERHGAALFRWAARTLAGTGATHMLIEADPDAAAFYARMGARRIGEAPSEAVAGRTLPLLRLDLPVP